MPALRLPDLAQDRSHNHPAGHAADLIVRLLHNRPAQSSLAALAGSAVIALFAQVALFIGPVPTTGQTLGLLIVASFLSPSLSVAAVLLYLAEGALGLPVFAGAHAGPAVLLGPTGGYLFAFIPTIWVAARLRELGWSRSLTGSMGAMMAASMVTLIIGAVWLAGWISLLQAGLFGTAGQELASAPAWRTAFLSGFLIFIPIAAVKALLALPAYWQPRRRPA